MTPAEHAATVDAGFDWTTAEPPPHVVDARRSLAALVVQAERATELERERDQLKAERNAAESMWSEEYTDTNLSPGMWALRLERERAERAETALPLLDRVIDEGVCRWHDSDQSDPTPLHAWLGLTEDEYSAWVEGQAAKLVARAALGETAP